MALLDGKWSEINSVPRSEEPDFGYAYLMIGIATASIAIGAIFGSIFPPDLVTTSGTATGYTHQHIPLAAYSGWVWSAIALAMLLPTATKGIRAKVTDRTAWSVLGLGVSGIWLAGLFLSVFLPVTVTGTAPWLTWFPLGALLTAIAAVIGVGVLCRFVKAAFFESPEAQPPAQTTRPTISPEPQQMTLRPNCANWPNFAILVSSTRPTSRQRRLSF